MGLHRLGRVFAPKDSSAGRFMGVSVIYGADLDHETPYMTRAWFGRLRFHVFHRGDQDPDCHDHPWGFWTFPLRSYVEEVLDERIETRWGHNDKLNVPFKHERRYFERRQEVVKAFRWNYRPATYRHRVLGAYAGRDIAGFPVVEHTKAVPTIVWREKPSRAWGFTKDRAGKWCWVPWKTYVYEGGKTAPCQDEKGSA